MRTALKQLAQDGATTNQVPLWNDSKWVAAGVPTVFSKRYINGLNLEYVSPTVVTCKSGEFRDAANDTDVILANDSNVDLTIQGGGGIDKKSMAPTTVDTTSGSATAIASASVISAFGTRAGTGTLSSSSTAVTGSSSKFLSEVAVGDLVGSSTTYGYARVSSIESDTALTLVAALPGGDAPGSTSFNIIENATFRAESAAQSEKVRTLSAAGTAIVADNTFSMTSTGQALTIGVSLPSIWLAIWLGNGGSGTKPFASTQRTTPFTISGYTTDVRRIGWVRVNSSGNILAFSQHGATRIREYIWEEAKGGDFTIVSGGTATSWTTVSCAGIVPPAARLVLFTIFNPTNSESSREVYLRPRGVGSATTSRNLYQRGVSPAGSIGLTGFLRAHCDSVQNIDYVTDVTNAGATIYVGGFVEEVS